MNETSNAFQVSEEYRASETKSYNIYHFFFVAFFGGVIPMMVLGTKNANWLHIPKKYSYSIIVVGILLLLSKYWAFSLVFNGTLLIKAQVVRYLYKFVCLLYYYLYLVMLTRPYKQHLSNQGELLPIIKPAIVWVIIGAVVEFALLRMVIA